MNNNTWTVKRLINWTTNFFNTHSIQTSRLDAEILLSHVLKSDRLFLYLNFEKPLSIEELKSYKLLVKRRAAHEPVAYITGSKEFWSLLFKVNKHVLIPRPETEVLVETSLNILKNSGAANNCVILDLGTGSGNIAISLVKELPGVKLMALDISKSAIAIARKNALEHNVSDRIEFICGNLFKSLKKGERFDLIVSNPPYIPTDDLEKLEPDLKYEPIKALDGKKDGMLYLTKIINQSSFFLKKNGKLLMEIGSSQFDQVKKTVQESSENGKISIVKDYSKKDRVVIIGDLYVK